MQVAFQRNFQDGFLAHAQGFVEVLARVLEGQFHPFQAKPFDLGIQQGTPAVAEGTDRRRFGNEIRKPVPVGAAQEPRRREHAALEALHLAGAFGNYINYASARRIGLLDFPQEKVAASGNTALAGAKMALFASTLEDWHYRDLLSRVRHVSLNETPRFQDIFVENMSFPEQ
ncbi:MAG: ASKHA domain-containing protein [Verrucomicrobiota bacterium]